MDSITLTDTCNFQFSGSDDDLLEVVELWRFALPMSLETFGVSYPDVTRTTKGTIVRIGMDVTFMSLYWELLEQSRDGDTSFMHHCMSTITVNRSGSIVFPVALESECRALADQLSMWGVGKSELTEQSTRLDDSDRAYWVDVVRQAEASGNRKRYLDDKDIPKSTYYVKRGKYSPKRGKYSP